MSRFLRLFEPLSRSCSSWTKKLADGPPLESFIANSTIPRHDQTDDLTEVPYLTDREVQSRKVFFEVYGCQMNVNDTEIVWSILNKKGYERVLDHREANVVLIMTCSIREGAEQKIWRRLHDLRRAKQRRDLQVGVLGCMAERLKTQLLEKEKSVDIVAGPDSYRDLPRLLETAVGGQSGVNVQLSLDETYADVTPVRLDERKKTAFVSIMRGCNNMCTYCIVPFTRGRERSRPMGSILDEVRHLSENGVKEVTLLGQNVNSYRDMSEESHPFIRFTDVGLAKGFKSKCKVRQGGLGFADLLHQVAKVDPEMRIRFTSPHPKDFPDEVLQVIASHNNICNHIHLPAQSGSTRVLDLMGRGYTREDYLELVHTIYDFMPNVSLTSDFITGFCGETEEEHQMTLSLVDQVKYSFCYAFPYSLREKTRAHRRLEDTVPLEDKKRRANEILEVFRRNAKSKFEKQIGDVQIVLVEGQSKRSSQQLFGRNEGNIKVILANEVDGETIQPGEYVSVRITACSSQTMIGDVLSKCTLQSASNDEEARQMSS